jgi:hypothetical protein
MARPRLQLDEEVIIELAKIHCTMEEIASVMKCSKDTLEDRYSAIIKEAKKHGKTSLRRYMWLNAKKGNTAMQIWLSKNLLGMREPTVIEAPREESRTGLANYTNKQRADYDSSKSKS